MAESKVHWMKDWAGAWGMRGENWSPWVGCTPCSPGCDNCWARRLEDGRLRHLGRCAPKIIETLAGPVGNPNGVWNDIVTPYFSRGPVYQGDKALMLPTRAQKPRLFWCCPQSDPLHEDIPDRQIYDMLAVAGATPCHSHLFLTKRGARMLDIVGADRARERAHGQAEGWSLEMGDTLWSAGWPLPNVTLGLTVCTPEEADAKVRHLLELGAAGWRTMLSIEPMLGPVDLTDVLADTLCYATGCGWRGWRDADAPRGTRLIYVDEPRGNDWEEVCPNCGGSMLMDAERGPDEKALLDWVIVGAESGKDRRPCPLEWVRPVVEQCADAGVPCYVKQLDIDGKLSRDPSEWPEWARVRQVPERPN